MHFFFGDDSRQSSPTRERMGPLVAAGGVIVKAEELRCLEKELNTLCASVGFPKNEEFKWSPGRELWMRDGLKGENRQRFFLDVLELAQRHNVTATIVIEDTRCGSATDSTSHEDDVSRLLLERIHWGVPSSSPGCVVIVDRPSGGRTDEDRFLSRCLENIQSGTEYVKHDRIALNVLSAPSKLVRLLQLADLITSCTTALVSGESNYSPTIFEQIKPLLATNMTRRGGIGVKIHPDYRYANLYHWLLGDSHYQRGNLGTPYPLPNRPYSASAETY